MSEDTAPPGASGFFSELAAGLWSALLPARCPLCRELLHASAPSFCPSCLKLMPLIAEPRCQTCGRPFLPQSAPPAGVCGFCLQEPPRFDQARTAGLYQPGLAQALREFKFNNRRVLAPALAGLLRESAAVWLSGLGVEAVIPVPLHPERLRERGFNQSVDLARPVARWLAAPLLLRALRRLRHTDPQVGLSLHQRRKNVKNAFLVPRPQEIKDKKLLLVDDVITTGATVNECAGVLKAAGARSVFVLALARAA